MDDREITKKQFSDINRISILRSATSAGANYRAPCRTRTKVEFIFKIKIVEEESDESLY